MSHEVSEVAVSYSVRQPPLGSDVMTIPPRRTVELTPPNRGLRLLILLILFAAAFVLRVDRIGEPLLEFHPMRQTRNAIFARGLYMANNPDFPQWQQVIAVSNKEFVGRFEPPIVDSLAAATYRIIGAEQVWIIRAYSSIFWLIGGGFLFWLASRTMSSDAAIFAAGFYLLLPFGVMGSRTFQADPLMVGLMIASISLIWHFHARPGIHQLFAAVVVSSLALLVKPICGPVIYVTFLGLQIQRRSLRAALTYTLM